MKIKCSRCNGLKRIYETRFLVGKGWEKESYPCFECKETGEIDKDATIPVGGDILYNSSEKWRPI